MASEKKRQSSSSNCQSFLLSETPDTSSCSFPSSPPPDPAAASPGGAASAPLRADSAPVSADTAAGSTGPAVGGSPAAAVALPGPQRRPRSPKG
ncbi:hypothetical protein THAR02_04339 [Trichoderma harzianum]|uniref:Uncharacterized protein n=1 Tax=Trichoderma harzianum TaxID=5544 RepID=A0A0F9ZTJ8_TRIHA|nr:hypothetical protein THAR02_04339 [Trichoderma harzianum]